MQKREMSATFLTGHVKPLLFCKHMYAHGVAVIVWMHCMGRIHTTDTYSNPPDLVHHQSQDTHREVFSSFPVEAVLIKLRHCFRKLPTKMRRRASTSQAAKAQQADHSASLFAL